MRVNLVFGSKHQKFLIYINCSFLSKYHTLRINISLSLFLEILSIAKHNRQYYTPVMNNNENTRKYRNIIDTKIVKGSRAIASTIATLICHNVEESLHSFAST